MAQETERPPNAIQVKQARVAVSAGFFMFGVALALWAVHIPAVTARLQLGPATLGFALLTVGIGAVISQPLTGRIVARTGSRPATAVSLPVLLASCGLLILAWSTSVLFAAAIIHGAAFGANVVAINTQASEVERARGRPTMSSFHGFFSVGGLIGSMLGGGFIGMGRQDGRGAAAVIVVLIVCSLAAARFLLRTSPASPPPGNAKVSAGGALVHLALLASYPAAVEGIVNNWSALYLTTVRGMTVAAAASGVALFALAMAICRLGGGPVVARLGERNVTLLGALLIVIGIAVVVLSPWSVLSPLGFALIAVGSANIFPVLIGVAARLPGVAPSAAVAAIGVGGVSGFLVGPPLIGFVAHAVGLELAFGCLAVAGVVMTAATVAYHWPDPEAPPATEQQR